MPCAIRVSTKSSVLGLVRLLDMTVHLMIITLPYLGCFTTLKVFEQRMAIIYGMDTPQKLTRWQYRHKNLLEEALLNPDVYQELSYIRRDVNSPLIIDDSDAFLDERLLRLMNKFGLQLECFELLKKFCSVGGVFDYSLIPRSNQTRTKPSAKLRPAAKHHREAYNMWLQQLMSITEITRVLQSRQIIIDVNHMSKIIRRMSGRDPNRGMDFGPKPGLGTRRSKS